MFKGFSQLLIFSWGIVSSLREGRFADQDVDHRLQQEKNSKRYPEEHGNEQGEQKPPEQIKRIVPRKGACAPGSGKVWFPGVMRLFGVTVTFDIQQLDLHIVVQPADRIDWAVAAPCSKNLRPLPKHSNPMGMGRPGLLARMEQQSKMNSYRFIQ
ncbi:hypothetical protein [Aestuariispira insulae]|uniref:hypothetical protein n=1 Tax=Aestuariispira insulae TaxID=1461337 RepID=UPI000E220467|nr:hypothetical protein [Aestuariispira insulae]